jgi:hypothetical protein
MRDAPRVRSPHMSTSALLGIVARIRAVEQRLARDEQARVATELVRKHVHALGNALQIVDLASAELVRRDEDDSDQLVAELRAAATDARGELAKIIGIARPAGRTSRGAPVAPIVRGAVERVGVAVPSLSVELSVELADGVASRLDHDELEALVFATVLDVVPLDLGAHVHVVVRERTISNARWIELVITDDRRSDGALPAFIEDVAHLAGGEVSLSDGRAGHELAIALPVA